MSAAATETVESTVRAQVLRRALDGAAVDGSVVSAGGDVGDLLLDGDTLRGILPTLSSWAAERAMPTLVYSLAGGLHAYDSPGGPVAEVPGDVAPHTPPTVALDIAFDAMATRGRPTMLVLDFAEDLFPNVPVLGDPDLARMREQLALRAADPVWRAQGHRIVLIARTGRVAENLLRLPGFVDVRIGLPDAEERAAALALMQTSTRFPLALEDGVDIQQVVRCSGGLTLDRLHRLRLALPSPGP